MMALGSPNQPFQHLDSWPWGWPVLERYQQTGQVLQSIDGGSTVTLLIMVSIVNVYKLVENW